MSGKIVDVLHQRVGPVRKGARAHAPTRRAPGLPLPVGSDQPEKAELLFDCGFRLSCGAVYRAGAAPFGPDEFRRGCAGARYPEGTETAAHHFLMPPTHTRALANRNQREEMAFYDWKSREMASFW